MKELILIHGSIFTAFGLGMVSSFLDGANLYGGFAFLFLGFLMLLLSVLINNGENKKY